VGHRQIEAFGRRDHDVALHTGLHAVHTRSRAGQAALVEMEVLERLSV
jgi:hypothetical protein